MAIDTDVHVDFKSRYLDSTKPDARAAAGFLVEIASHGPMTVATVSVNGATRARTFDTADPASVDDMRSFIAYNETQPAQVFYLPGITRNTHSIPANEDMVTARSIVLDFDPDKTLPLAEERDRLRGIAHTLIEGPVQPRAIVDTGGGMQVVYQLAVPVPIDTDESRADFAALMKALARSHGADTATCTAKNLFRVPGTYNWPTPAKKRAGRERTVSGIWHQGGPRTTLDELRALCVIQPEDISATAVDFEGITEQDVIACLNAPDALPARVTDFLRTDPELIKAVAKPDPQSLDRSGNDNRLCMTLARFRMPAGDIALALAAYGAKVEEFNRRGTLFAYVINTTRKAVAAVAPERFHDGFQDAQAEEEQQKRQQAHRGRLVPLSLDDALSGLFDSHQNSLVDGFMQRREVTVIYGKSGSGKTFVCLDLLYRVSLGIEWNRRRTVKTAVVYIAAESPHGVRYRLQALKDLYGHSDAFYLVPATINLFDANVDLAPLIENIARLGADIGIIAIDTLARVMLGGNENSTQDMSRLVANGDILRDRFNANIVWVHHTGKDTSLGARGSSALVAATDTELEISGTANVGSLRVTKMRDRDPFEHRFKLRQVKVGAFPTGEEVTSCVIEWVDMPQTPGLPSSVTSARDAVLRVLRMIDAPATIGEIMAASRLYNIPIPIGQTAVRMLLTRSCDNAERFFSRTQRGSPRAGKKVEFLYGLYDE